ncbi:MAG: hypothetical protein HYU64_02050 [Armatimonadetes bacterium]|nr:hypothetical protein [Armatimonadota bacterium]
MEKIQKTSEHQERDPMKEAKKKYSFELEELEERIAPKRPTGDGSGKISCFWR